MLSEEKIVREVLGTWAGGPAAVKASFEQYCADDMVWWNSARGGIEGKAACLATLDAQNEMTGGYAYVKTPIRTLLAAPGIVFVERSDDIYRDDDSLIAAVPVVGVIEFRDNLIMSWRDYCDDWMRAHRDAEADRSLA